MYECPLVAVLVAIDGRVGNVKLSTRVCHLATVPYDTWYRMTSARVLCCEFVVV